MVKTAGVTAAQPSGAKALEAARLINASRQASPRIASALAMLAGAADVEPQALMDGAEAAARGDRAVPEEVGREGPVGQLAREQPLRDASGCR